MSYIKQKRDQGRINETPFLDDWTSDTWGVPRNLPLKGYLNHFWAKLPIDHKLKGFDSDEVKSVEYLPHSGCLMEFTLFGRSLWTVLPDEMLDEWIELGSDVSEMAYDLNKLKNFLKEEDCLIAGA